MVKIDEQDGITCLWLQPNRSATWRQTQCAIAVASVTTLSVAALWALQGLWLVLPFAGLEVLLLITLGYQVCSATYHQQVILVSKDKVEVQWGKRAPKQRWHFNRNATQVEVVRPRHSLSPLRLVLHEGDARLAIAERLSAADVKHTLEQLRGLGLPLRFSGTTSAVAAEGFDQITS